MTTPQVAAISSCLGLVIGFALCHFLESHGSRLMITSQVVALSDVDGRELGRLPQGTEVVAYSLPSPKGETGWWGMVPVYFGDEREANALLTPKNGISGEPVRRRVVGMALNQMPKLSPTKN